MQPLTQKPSDYVARVYDVFLGADGNVYVVEELIYRRLKALSPLRNTERFLRIARDLSMGLAHLHELEPKPRVHRDLKLDNCGVDYADRAKIFDLGSATSEPGKVQGTTLTRAPELFEPLAECHKESDVWALVRGDSIRPPGGRLPVCGEEFVKNRPHETASGDAEEDAARRVANFLRAFLAGEAGMSGRQWPHAVNAFEKLQSKLKPETQSEIRELVAKVQALRAT